jgi:hypothetical protein
MAAPVYPANVGWLLAEDDAVKQLFKGWTVPNDKGEAQPVQVWFRFPDPERQIVYPFITLDLLDIVPATELWHSEYPHQGDYLVDATIGQNRWYRPTDIDNTPVPLYDPSVSDTVVDGIVRRNYLAYRLFYQASYWAKTAIHDRIQTSKLVQRAVRPGPFWLYVAADDTYRRTEWMGWTTADIPTQDGNKRIFRKAITFSVQTEIPQDFVEEITERIQPVDRVLVKGWQGVKGDLWDETAEREYWTESDPNSTDEPYWEEFAHRDPPPGT